MKPIGRLAVIAVLALLAGCNETDLYGQLSERQVNEVIAALQAEGIRGDKATKDGTVWSVRVAQADFGRAVDVLGRQGLPREQYESLGKVFRKEGFVSSPLEERARLMYGLSQELSGTIAAIDGVVVARVHLAVPERDPLSDKPRPASASVMIKHRPGVDLGKQLGQIKALVVNSVEGLTYDNVTVSLFVAGDAAGESPTAPSRQRDMTARREQTSFNRLLDQPIAWGAVGVGLPMLAFVVGRLRRTRPTRDEEAS